MVFYLDHDDETAGLTQVIFDTNSCVSFGQILKFILILRWNAIFEKQIDHVKLKLIASTETESQKLEESIA